MDKKVGIIVPYRNRYTHLIDFKEHIVRYLTEKKLNFELIIVNQDNAKLFNRGMLLNIGFKYAKKLKCDYVVFHDVDMLPLDVDYSYESYPVHLASGFIYENKEKERLIFDEYFGGITLFTIEDFEKIDGYSNKYWGWGYEDDDLLLRCKVKGVKLDTRTLQTKKRKGNTVRLNGVDAYIRSKNIINTRNSFSIAITFQPENTAYNPDKPSDEFTAFSLPGYDLAIGHTSFRRYNFTAFDNKLQLLYINSNLRPEYNTTIIVTVDSLDKIISVYQDGTLIGNINDYGRLYSYSRNTDFYLGVGNPDREVIPNFFKGSISSFAYYDNKLGEKEVQELFGTDKLYTELTSSKNLKLYYDANFIENYHLKDLTGGGNNGKLIKCEIVPHQEINTSYKVPFRKRSVLKSLPHEENGYLNGRWSDQNTRWNQLRFHNEVSKNLQLLDNDGLSTLTYHTHGIIKEGNITILNVGI